MSKNKPRSQPIPDDWNGVDTKLMMFCIPASQKWEAAAHGALWTLGRGRTWDETTGDISAVQDVYRQIIEDTIMACNLDDLTTELDRIATSLESLDEKTPELIDLDTLVGLVNGGIAPGNLEAIAPILEIMSALSGLLPSIKINPADFLIDAFDRLSFKGPVVANLITMNGLLGTIAVGTLGEGGLKIVELLNTTVGTFVTRMGQLADMTIRATWDIWPDYLQGIFKGFIGTGQGGDHPGIPDEDKTLRVVAYNSINVQCGTCGGGSSTCGCDAFGGIDAGVQDNPGEVPAGTAPTSWAKGDDYYMAYKCSASNWLVESILVYFDRLRKDQSTQALVLGGTIFYLLPVGYAVLLSATLAQTLTRYLSSKGSMSSAFFSDVDTFYNVFAAGAEALKADVFAAASPAAVNTLVGDLMGTAISGEADQEFVDRHLETLLSSEVANVIFNDGHSIGSIIDYPPAANCSAGGQIWKFLVDQEGWLYSVENTVPPSLSAGGTIPDNLTIELDNHHSGGAEGRWYIPLGTFSITITAQTRMWVHCRFTKWCATGFRLYIKDDQGNEDYTLSPPVVNTDNIFLERFASPVMIGNQLAEIGIFTSVGPACGSLGETDMQIDQVEIVV